MTTTAADAIAGADGCRAGWAVATEAGVEVVPSLPEWLRHNDSRMAVLGVDMPVGLPPSWARRADVAARAFLPPGRRASVFPTLPRSLVTATSWAEANVASRERFGRGVPRQSWGLVARLREVDELATTAGERGLAVVEIHPECSFLAMTGAPLPPKRTDAGAAARRAAIASWYGGVIPERLPGARVDDVLDALAVLWSARRYAAGTAVELGAGERDERGLPMRVVV